MNDWHLWLQISSQQYKISLKIFTDAKKNSSQTYIYYFWKICLFFLELAAT